MWLMPLGFFLLRPNTSNIVRGNVELFLLLHYFASYS